jgi:DEAD/DEAH box helicase domain-containing protein
VYLAATTPETEGTHPRLPRALEIGNDHHAICWAASHTDALAPTPHWGSGEGGLQFVRVYHDRPLAPIPTAWRPLTTRELRSAPDTLYAIAITTELNGSRRHFGQRAWQRVCEAVPQLHQRLVGPQPLAAVHYSDRYLRSPLTVLLLRDLLGALAAYPGGLVASTRVAIATSQVPTE